MLKVEITKRRCVYINFTEDTPPNRGGFYCQVYDDPLMNYEIDGFTIHAYELAGADDKKRNAYIIATSRAKSRLR